MNAEKHTKELYNSFLIDPYIRLIKKRYPLVDINEVLAHAGIMPWEAADESHWLTQEHINEFTKQAIKLTGNPQLPKEAGQYVFNLESTGVEIIVSPQHNCREERFQCENRLGLFEAAVKAFRYDMHAIDHPECMFNGDPHCRYIVKWNISTTALMRRWRNISAIALPLLNLPVLLTNPSILLGTVPSSLCLYLLLDRLAVGATLDEVSASIDHLSSSRNQLINQLDANYNNAMLTSEVGHAISLQSSIDKVIAKVVKTLEKRLDFDRGMILLANESKTKLVYRAGFGHIDEHRHILQQASFRLDNPASRGVFVEAFKEQTPYLVDDFETFERRHSSHSVNLAKALNVKSFVCCPIICEGETVNGGGPCRR
jgi:uncharacterized protein YigA (DUF484 family)